MIFIEKPFVEKCLSTREKNEKFFKRSLMVTMVKISNINRSRRDHLSTSFVGKQNEPSKINTSVEVYERKLEKTNLVDYSMLSNSDSLGLIEDKIESGQIQASKKPPTLQLPSKQETEKPQPKLQETLPKLDTPIKRTRNDSNAVVVAVSSKKMKSEKSESSDYDSYEDEAEDKLLIIDKSEAIDDDDDDSDEDNVPKSPTPEEVEMTPTIQSKIIPLEKEATLKVINQTNIFQLIN